MSDRREPTGWIGWVIFAGVVMVILGGFNIIYGLVAIFDDQHFVPTRGGLLVFDLTTWGWITLIFGIVQVIAASALIAGRLWARLLGVILAGLNAWGQLALIDAQPVWSSIIIIVDVLVIYALTVHGREMASVD